MCCLLNYTTKFQNNVFICVYLTTFIEFDWLIHSGESTNCNSQKGLKYVYHHWRCTSIYRPLSFPFRSLTYMCLLTFFVKDFYHYFSVFFQIKFSSLKCVANNLYNLRIILLLLQLDFLSRDLKG